MSANIYACHYKHIASTYICMVTSGVLIILLFPLQYSRTQCNAHIYLAHFWIPRIHCNFNIRLVNFGWFWPSSHMHICIVILVYCVIYLIFTTLFFQFLTYQIPRNSNISFLTDFTLDPFYLFASRYINLKIILIDDF